MINNKIFLHYYAFFNFRFQINFYKCKELLKLTFCSARFDSNMCQIYYTKKKIDLFFGDTFENIMIFTNTLLSSLLNPLEGLSMLSCRKLELGGRSQLPALKGVRGACWKFHD